MKGFLQLMVACCVIWQAGSALAQDTTANEQRMFDNIRVTSGFKSLDLMVGDNSRGDYSAAKLELDAGSQRTTLYSFTLTSTNYGDADILGLDAIARAISLGFTVPAFPTLTFRGVYNNWIEYPSSEAVDAYGFYGDFVPDTVWRVEFGTEQFFNQAPELYYTTVFRSMSDSSLFSKFAAGVSNRYNQQQAEHQFESRFMMGGIARLALDTQFTVLIASAVSGRLDPISWNSDDRAVNVGLAIPIAFEDHRPWAPSTYMSYRTRPGSRNVLIFGGLGGKAVNTFVVDALFRSGFQALLIPTRVVNNRTFNIAVLKSHASEFGRLAWEIAWYQFDITESISATAFEAGAYFTVQNWSPLGLRQPFIGYANSYEDQIYFDYGTYQLRSAGHTQHVVELGGRFRIGIPARRGFERGYCRIGVSTLFGSSGKYEGTMLELTGWF